MRLKFKTEVNSSLEQVKSGFNRDLFLQLKPPFLQVILDRFDGCEPGNEVHLRTGSPGFLQTWVSLITEAGVTADAWFFVDEGKQLPFPLRNWKHRHEFRRTAKGNSEILDEIEYSSGSRLLDLVLYVPLWFVFSGRDSVYLKVFGKAK